MYWELGTKAPKNEIIICNGFSVQELSPVEEQDPGKVGIIAINMHVYS